KRDEILKELLARVRVSYQDIASDLLWGFAGKHDELLQILVAKRKEANANDDYLRCMLSKAAASGNAQQLRWLFEQGASIINNDSSRIDPRANIGPLLMTIAMEEKSVSCMSVLFNHCSYSDLV